ncbi:MULTISPECIES: CPBP family glutamic-type intramembrane protease [Ruminococcus]|uniref:CAAX prenyl protease 2/Lysostaphin resistance protein A-like domain-containing protein n=1 Tax=Ruminococcus flavefaciens TaxID=1265 RepID=A0A1M7M154_RUMFL|nr:MULTISPECIES: CPBP family intramembrane glutamic endopeptidase [Ruminococcus]MCR4795611.1 CPBP family intramembrane metalloprotease [Ruminococcus sp.]SHM83885.1 hypothetical protein SAMN04487860_11746 [Ruminococcus flavefaciens]
MKLTDTSGNTIISVVDQFDYSTQNQTYNDNFKKWRKDKENPYAFNFELDRRESVFVEGKGFENRSASKAERDCIGKVMNIIGIAMLMWILIDNIISKLVISVFDFIGFDLHTSFFSTGLYGGSLQVITALLATSFIKVLVPAVYLHKKLRMPPRLEYMSTLNHASDMLGTICMTMAVSTVTCLPNIYTNRTMLVFNYFRSINADANVWNQEQFVVYTICDIVIISTLHELFFHGAIFNALRQFGDVFAIIITTAMSGLLVQDFRELPAALLISAIASIGMLRSGTIVTAIFVQICFKMYRLALVLLEDSSPDKIFLKRNTFMLVIFIIGAAGVMMLYIFKRRKPEKHIAEFNSKYSVSQRLEIACKSFPVPAVICLCLLAAFIKVFF